MPNHLKYLNHHWTVEKLNDETFILRAVEPHELHAGRTVAVTPTGTWECSRDGQAKPLLKFDGSSRGFDLAKAHVAKGAKS